MCVASSPSELTGRSRAAPGAAGAACARRAGGRSGSCGTACAARRPRAWARAPGCVTRPSSSMTLMTSSFTCGVPRRGGSLLAGSASDEPYNRATPRLSRQRRPRRPGPMKIHVRDVVSFFGRDYLVEGVVGYDVNGKRFQLARAVDGDAVLWVEPLHDDGDERLLVLQGDPRSRDGGPAAGDDPLQRRHVRAAPRPASVTVERRGHACPTAAPRRRQLWRYHAAGDLTCSSRRAGGALDRRWRVGPPGHDRDPAGTGEVRMRAAASGRCSASRPSASRTAPASASSSTAARRACRSPSRRSRRELDRRRPGQSAHHDAAARGRRGRDPLGRARRADAGHADRAWWCATRTSAAATTRRCSTKYRPSHADYTYQTKFGIRAWQGGGRASARETIGRVAAGAIARKVLALAGDVADRRVGASACRSSRRPSTRRP